jgi:hypothetical protein
MVGKGVEREATMVSRRSRPSAKKGGPTAEEPPPLAVRPKVDPERAAAQ